MALLGPGESQAGVVYNPPIIARSPGALYGWAMVLSGLGELYPLQKGWSSFGETPEKGTVPQVTS